MGETRVAGHRRMGPNDVCNVRFRCMECKREVVKDAYKGPVECSSGHHVKFMRPISLLMPHPDASDTRGAPTWMQDRR